MLVVYGIGFLTWFPMFLKRENPQQSCLGGRARRGGNVWIIWIWILDDHPTDWYQLQPPLGIHNFLMAKRLNFLDLWPIFFVAGTEEWEDWAQWGVWFRSGSQWVKGVPWFREVGRESHVNLRDIGWWIFMESWVRKFWNLVPRYGLYSWSSQLYPLKKLSCTIYNTWSGQLYPLKKLSSTILYVYNIYICMYVYGVGHLMRGSVTGTAGHRQDGDSSSVVSMHQAVEATPTGPPLSESFEIALWGTPEVWEASGKLWESLV